MAKKATNASRQQSGQQLNVRCTDDDAALFARAAEIEGADTAQRWMVQVCRKRARQIISAAESGQAVRISETVIVPDEGK
ncbi:type II toxin -antitoxin system TacA 1-like antitoxin [Planctomicrobium sp. SH664]|uniref:type II toxin -antitoxin system TacA 1-like antitoxin n=1 Tax=Planctomicrobium sp. SH664 TaxID=3448125 RepID=UPI003F5BEAFE